MYLNCFDLFDKYKRLDRILFVVLHFTKSLIG